MQSDVVLGGFLIADLFFRALVAIVFATAAVAKLRSPVATGDTARAIRLLLPVTARAAVTAGRLVLALEIVVVCLLIVPGTGTVGLALAATVLAVYTAALAVGIAKGRRVACHCFGNDGEMMGLSHVLRNGLLTLAAGAGLVVGSDAGSPAGTRDVVMIGAGLVAGWLCTRWDDMSFLLGAVFRDPLLSPRASR